MRWRRRLKPARPLRRPPHLGGLGDPRVPFDGGQGEVQPPGTFQEADVRIEQIVDLLPPLKGGDLSALKFAHWEVVAQQPL